MPRRNRDDVTCCTDKKYKNAVSKMGQSFFLTGGSALGIFYLQHRLSFDLDFFSTEPHIDWHLLENDIRNIAWRISAEFRSITATPAFHRFELKRAQEREILDFVLEPVAQIDPEKPRFGSIRVDTLREIMVNKVCTLVSRCEIKDLIDLYFLRKRGLQVRDHLEDARRKEAGLDPATIAFLLSQVTIETPLDYLLEPLDLGDLRAFVNELQRELAATAYPRE